MVKRMTDISLDEWLARSTVTPEASHTAAAAAKEEPVQTDCPTAEVASTTVTAEPVPTTVADVVNQGRGTLIGFGHSWNSHDMNDGKGVRVPDAVGSPD